MAEIITDKSVLLSAWSRKRATFDIGDGREVGVTELSLTSRAAIQDAIKREVSDERVRAMVVAHGCDVFTDDDIDTLMTDTGRHKLEKASAFVLALSGLGADAVEDAAKNSESDRKHDSSSGSH